MIFRKWIPMVGRNFGLSGIPKALSEYLRSNVWRKREWLMRKSGMC
jgi:hypothetical protein